MKSIKDLSFELEPLVKEKFDDHGNLIEKIILDYSLQPKEVINFNNKGQIVSKSFYDEDESFLYKICFYYDHLDRVIKEIHDDSEIIEYFYNFDGYHKIQYYTNKNYDKYFRIHYYNSKFQKVKSESDKIKIIFKYDDLGNIIFKSKLTANNYVEENFSLDENGRIVEYSNSLGESTKYEYYDNGDLFHIKDILLNGKVTHVWKLKEGELHYVNEKFYLDGVECKHIINANIEK